ncbi:hypothetical protein HanIR_Chr17g0849371 [Helianthus annuus]|nr:hypothetical protein HanIR_Chr17g0849371 [Helianthus annuus]
MSYYSKQRADLAVIGAEAFALLDDNFSGGRRKSKPVETGPPIFFTPKSYLVQQVPAKKIDMVVEFYQADKMYGGHGAAVLVDYPKRKPAVRVSFFNNSS